MLCCPECLVRKRRPAQLVAEAVAAPVAAVAMAAPPKQRQSLKWLDVHCHVFNLADLPVAEFVEKTRLSGLAIAAAPIGWLISNFFKEQAVSADDELWQLLGYPAAIASARLSTRDALDAMRNQSQNRLPPMRNPVTGFSCAARPNSGPCLRRWASLQPPSWPGYRRQSRPISTRGSAKLLRRWRHAAAPGCGAGACCGGGLSSASGRKSISISEPLV